MDKTDAEEILAACTDTRNLSKGVLKQLLNREESDNGEEVDGNVGEVAWKLLSQTWSMMPDAWVFLVEALHEQNVQRCGAAALLLQHGKNVPQQQRGDAMKRIRTILMDEEPSHYPLDGSDRKMRLDDVLFETLWVLAE